MLRPRVLWAAEDGAAGGGGAAGDGAAGGGGAQGGAKGGSEGGGGDGGAGAKGGGEGGKGGGPVPGFLHQASPEVRDALQTHGFKTLDDLGRRFLEHDKHAGERGVVLPGDKATDADWQTFHQAIGVPADAKAYEFRNGEQAPDEMMTNFARELFPKAGITLRGAKILNDGWNKLMGDTLKAHAAAVEKAIETGEGELAREWKADHAGNYELANRAAEFAGLKPAEVKNLKAMLGVPRAMKFLLGYANAVASDGPGPGGGTKSFTITSPEGARAELQRMQADAGIGAILRDAGHKEHKTVKAKWDRLTDQIARFDNQGG